ncbi:hypothetical protein O181_021193 [Austropuccinia psidii MF-1]|uniref:Uncharacterized protein n=1 Tax=Austropuccinia psidii MF-1 TaxID=1389203 RepID=A0A9Q3GV77_9BASI|nr:hypothetical protein [Austropuccinia psidii MF-1]
MSTNNQANDTQNDNPSDRINPSGVYDVLPGLKDSNSHQDAHQENKQQPLDIHQAGWACLTVRLAHWTLIVTWVLLAVRLRTRAVHASRTKAG